MKRALLVIDPQNEYFTGKLPVTHPANSFQNILQAIDAAANSIQTICIQHTVLQPDAKLFVKNSNTWELHPEITRRKFNLLLEKNYPGSFTGTILEKYLLEHAIDTITICGYMTQMCCDTTARQAFHLGFKVEFLADATGTRDFSNSAGQVTAEELHRAILVTQAMRFSQVLNTEAWINSLSQ
ncbi:MAG: cysteine hydrolase family protein [Victivallaceae bacterium]|jgi:nicotinamidase-related amidase